MGGVDNRSMIGWSCMDNRGSMDNGSMVSRGSMNKWGVIGWAMGKDSLSSMETVRGVSNSSNSSTESLGLCGASVLSLVWLGH